MFSRLNQVKLVSVALKAFAGGALVLGTLCAQIDPAKTPLAEPAKREDSLADSLGRIREGDPWFLDYHQVAAAGAVQVIPDLKKRFASADDVIEKCIVASALVRLGLRQGRYWDYLENEATMAIESDAPYPIGLDSSGRIVSEGEAQPFVLWAKTHGLPLEIAVEETIQLPGRVELLGETRDTRAIPLLRRGLNSPDFIVQAYAAGGLAKIGDKDSIPLITQACDRAAPEVAIAIAEAGLTPFDDPEARSAARRFEAAYEAWKAGSVQQK